MDYLTVKEVAELKGCSEQYVQKNIKDGKIEAVVELNERNRPKYLVPVSALPEPLQMKYYGKLTSEAQLCLPKAQETAEPQKIKRTKTVIKKEFGEFNADEREQITFWTDLIREWKIRRREYDNCAEGDMVFIAETKRLRRAYLAEHNISLSRDILYRKYRAYRERVTEPARNRRTLNVPPTILDLLGIEMRNAIPKNGRAKPIERMFLTLKNTISRLVATFTGGNIIERPESLKYQLKHGYVPYQYFKQTF